MRKRPTGKAEHGLGTGHLMCKDHGHPRGTGTQKLPASMVRNCLDPQKSKVLRK